MGGPPYATSRGEDLRVLDDARALRRVCPRDGDAHGEGLTTLHTSAIYESAVTFAQPYGARAGAVRGNTRATTGRTRASSEDHREATWRDGTKP
jgi:hypothetical protein